MARAKHGETSGVLDRAILERLVSIYENADLFDEAVEQLRSGASAIHQQHRAELNTVSTDIQKSQDAIERYLLAFENGSLSEETCDERIQALGAKLAELRNRRLPNSPKRSTRWMQQGRVTRIWQPTEPWSSRREW